MNARPAYSYIRFSSGAQSRGDSARRQREGFVAWCREHGAEPVEDYADLGVSAFRGKNATEGALREFLHAVESGRVPRGAVLVVESLDRISRLEVNRALPIFLQVINAGVSVATLADGHIYDAESPNMMLELMYSLLIMSRANEESAMKSKRLLAAWEAKRAKIAPGSPFTRVSPGWLEWEKDGWRIIPERAETVRTLFRMAAEGTGFTSIARKMNEDGVPSMKGGQWSAASVRVLIESRSVLGEFTPHRTVSGKRVPLAPVPGYFPSIIPAELWGAVARLRSLRTVRARSADAVSNPFRGVLFDPDGNPFHAKTCRTKGRVYVYLRTQAGVEGRGSRQSWPLAEFLAFFVAVARECWRLPAQAADGSAEALRLRAEALGERVANLVEAVARGGASDALLRALGEAEAERAALMAEADAARSPSKWEGEEVDWGNAEERASVIAQTVRRIVADSRAPRWFSVEFYERPEPIMWRETEGGEVIVEGLHPEAAETVANVIQLRLG